MTERTYTIEGDNYTIQELLSECSSWWDLELASDFAKELVGLLALESAALKAAQTPRPMESAPGDAWIIQHLTGGVDAWWRPRSAGYTTEIIAAGIYTEVEAVRLAANRPHMDTAIRLVDALRGLELSGSVAGLLNWLPLSDQDGGNDNGAD